MPALVCVLAAMAFVPTADAQTSPTNAGFIAQADQICGESNPRNFQLLKKSRALINKGRLRAGGRILIRNERFELDYYGEIADLPRPADAAFNELVDEFLEAQRGQAKARLKLGRLIRAGRPPRTWTRPDNRAFRLLRKAGRFSEQIGFTQC